MKDVQCYELFGGIALKYHAFSFSFRQFVVDSLTLCSILSSLKRHNRYSLIFYIFFSELQLIYAVMEFGLPLDSKFFTGYQHMCAHTFALKLFLKSTSPHH